MKTVPKMEREVAHLHQQDFKKLFPNQYYSKYAVHQKVASFQQSLLKQTHNPPPPTIQKTSSHPQLPPKPSTVKLTRFDGPDDILSKNKEEKVRMQVFVKDLNQKLKSSGSKSTTQLRTPLTGFQPIPENMLERLKLIEDAQYEAQLEYLRQKKGKSYKYMNFVLRSRQQSMNQQKMSMRLDRSIIAESAESKSVRDIHLTSTIRPPITYTSKPEQMQSFAHSKRASEFVEKARSQITGLNPQDQKTDIKCILAMNRSIRKLNSIDKEATKGRLTQLKKGNPLGSSYSDRKDTDRIRKDLIEMTENIRNQVKAIEVLSHFQTAMMNRTIREKVKLKE